MGRLIDADALIKHLTDWRLQECPIGICDEETETYKTICECIEAVSEQPTAYNVEKVVAELEQQAYQYNRRARELVEKSTEAGIHNKGKACSYEHAIEIVKRGGVE